jgi:hypothetical protein
VTHAFDAQTLDALAAAEEIEVETTRPDGHQRRTTIWVVVVEGGVFIRSVRGERGHWWQAAIDRPDEVSLIVDGRRLPVRVESAADERSVARVSAALARKYAGDPDTPSMLRYEVLGTTLRVEPR